MWRRLPPALIGWAGLLVAWSAVTYGGLVKPDMLPSPGDLAATCVRLAREGFDGVPLWQHIAASMERCLGGFVLAVLVGVPTGLLMGYYAFVGRAIGPILSFIRPIPPIAFIPLAVLYFGIGNTAKIVLIFFGAFLFMVLNTQTAVAAVPRLLVRAGLNQGLTPVQLLRHVILPGSMPGILTGMRTAFAISWALVVAAELIAADSGLGFMIEQAGTFFKLNDVYAGILMIGLIGVFADSLIVLLQRRVLHWQGR